MQNLFWRLCISLFPLWGLGGCTSPPAPHSSNSFQEEYTDGTVKKDCKFIGVINQSMYKHHCNLYHENGNLKEEGDFINDTIEIGWHTYYRQSGSIKARREFLELSKQSFYLNRVIRFEINGDTDKAYSNYYSVYFDRDTINEGEYLLAHFKLDAPYYKDSYIQVIITDSDGNDEILPVNYSHFVHHAIKSSSKGKFELKGFIDEIEKLEQKGDTIKAHKRTLYFDKSYWVR